MYPHNYDLIQAILEAKRADAARRNEVTRARAAPGLWHRVVDLFVGRRPVESVAALVSLDSHRAEAAGTECCAAETPAA